MLFLVLIIFIVMEKIIIEFDLDIISNFLFYYHFIHSYAYLSGQASAFVTDVTYSQEQTKHQFLFKKIFSGVSFYFKIFFCIFIFILN